MNTLSLSLCLSVCLSLSLSLSLAHMQVQISSLILGPGKSALSSSTLLGHLLSLSSQLRFHGHDGTFVSKRVGSEKAYVQMAMTWASQLYVECDTNVLFWLSLQTYTQYVLQLLITMACGQVLCMLNFSQFRCIYSLHKTDFEYSDLLFNVNPYILAKMCHLTWKRDQLKKKEEKKRPQYL